MNGSLIKCFFVVSFHSFFCCQVEESLEGMPIQFGQAGILDSVHLFSMKEVR